jgi:hypothetical protein
MMSCGRGHHSSSDGAQVEWEPGVGSGEEGGVSVQSEHVPCRELVTLTASFHGEATLGGRLRTCTPQFDLSRQGCRSPGVSESLSQPCRIWQGEAPQFEHPKYQLLDGNKLEPRDLTVRVSSKMLQTVS